MNTVLNKVTISIYYCNIERDVERYIYAPFTFSWMKGLITEEASSLKLYIYRISYACILELSHEVLQKRSNCRPTQGNYLVENAVPVSWGSPRISLPKFANACLVSHGVPTTNLLKRDQKHCEGDPNKV